MQLNTVQSCKLPSNLDLDPARFDLVNPVRSRSGHIKKIESGRALIIIVQNINVDSVKVNAILVVLMETRQCPGQLHTVTVLHRPYFTTHFLNYFK